ncbi:MAG: DNA methyltransferase, partial [Streptococcus sp.]|nr:DNA methyltransferase [Streptococcus sp.]
DKQIAETTAKLESMLTQLVGTNPDAQKELADFLAKW